MFKALNIQNFLSFFDVGCEGRFLRFSLCFLLKSSEFRSYFQKGHGNWLGISACPDVYSNLGNRHSHPDPVALTSEASALKIFLQAKEIQVFSLIFSRKS